MGQLDMPYMIVLLLLVVLFISSYKDGVHKKTYTLIACVIVFCFLGFRAPVVGGDTYEYVNGFLDGTSMKYRENAEKLFLIYNQILSFIGCDSFFYILINTIVSFVPLLFLIKKYSLNVPLSLVYAFTLQIMLLYFTALREVLALGFLLCAIYYILQGRKWKWIVYSVTLLLVYNIHHMVFYYGLLFALIYYIPLNKKISIIIIISSTVLGITLQYFNSTRFLMAFMDSTLMEMVDNRVSIYIDQALYDNNTYSVGLFKYINSALCIFALWYSTPERCEHWFFKIVVVGIAVYNLFADMTMISRIVNPFFIFIVIVLTWPLEKHHFAFNKNNAIFTILFLLLLLYEIKVFSTWDTTLYDRMHPYSFFFEDYKYIPYNYD